MTSGRRGPARLREPMRSEVRYTGRVQGVGFRAMARGVARRHAVVGWVRNEPDGSVLLVAQGDAGEIERCLIEIRDTLGHFIRAETRANGADEPGLEGFEIRY